MAALPLLASTAEATAWGFPTVSDVSLKKASARIRGYLSQDITADTSTIKARGPVFRLPQRPVVAVSAVLDSAGRPVVFDLAGSVLTTASLDVLTVTYSHGFAADALPEPLVEFVCQVAQRLGTPTPELAAGVQSEGTGPFSVSYGWDSYKAQAGLTQGEKDVLDRIWPRLPQIIVMGSPA